MAVFALRVEIVSEFVRWSIFLLIAPKAREKEEWFLR